MYAYKGDYGHFRGWLVDWVGDMRCPLRILWLLSDGETQEEGCGGMVGIAKDTWGSPIC